MELLIGIPMALIGIVLWVMMVIKILSYIADEADSVLSLALGITGFFLCLGGFPILWSFITFLFITYPAILLFPLGMGLTAGAAYVHNKVRPERDEPMPLEYYTKLKRQDAAQAVADWDARAEELLIEAGVACICPTTPVVTHLTWEDRRITKTKRHPVIYCPVHAWRGLELAKSPENLVG